MITFIVVCEAHEYYMDFSNIEIPPAPPPEEGSFAHLNTLPSPTSDQKSPEENITALNDRINQYEDRTKVEGNPYHSPYRLLPWKTETSTTIENMDRMKQQQADFQKINDFSKRVANGETLDSILPPSEPKPTIKDYVIDGIKYTAPAAIVMGAVDRGVFNGIPKAFNKATASFNNLKQRVALKNAQNKMFDTVAKINY